MNFGRFVFRNATRNRLRTALTVASIGLSIFLLLTLQALLHTLNNPPETEASVRRLAVRRSTGLAQAMPVSYQRRIDQVPGVELTMPIQWFGGQYIEPKNFFANFAVDPDALWDMYPEYEATEETRRAFSARHPGARGALRRESPYPHRRDGTASASSPTSPPNTAATS